MSLSFINLLNQEISQLHDEQGYSEEHIQQTILEMVRVWNQAKFLAPNHMSDILSSIREMLSRAQSTALFAANQPAYFMSQVETALGRLKPSLINEVQSIKSEAVREVSRELQNRASELEHAAQRLENKKHTNNVSVGQSYEKFMLSKIEDRIAGELKHLQVRIEDVHEKPGQLDLAVVTPNYKIHVDCKNYENPVEKSEVNKVRSNLIKDPTIHAALVVSHRTLFSGYTSMSIEKIPDPDGILPDKLLILLPSSFIRSNGEDVISVIRLLIWSSDMLKTQITHANTNVATTTAAVRETSTIEREEEAQVEVDTCWAELLTLELQQHWEKLSQIESRAEDYLKTIDNGKTLQNRFEKLLKEETANMEAVKTTLMCLENSARMISKVVLDEELEAFINPKVLNPKKRGPGRPSGSTSSKKPKGTSI